MLILFRALMIRLLPACPNLPPTALRSRVVFSELLPTAKTGISTDALLRLIDAMKSALTSWLRPRAGVSKPVDQPRTGAGQRQRGQPVADHAHRQNHDPGQRLGRASEQRRPDQFDQMIERVDLGDEAGVRNGAERPHD